MSTMAANWFRRKTGFRFVSVGSGRLDREEWTKIRRASRWGRSRRARRVLMLLWAAVLAIDVTIAVDIAHRDPALSILPTLLMFGFALWALYRTGIGLAQPKLEDRAVMQYGAEFDALKEQQRGEVFSQHVRDNIRGKISADEREAELRLRSEREAYRLLRPGLPIAIAAYWAMCLLGPFGQAREALAITAIAFTWLALAVLVLPVMIRIWTEPNEIGEPRIVDGDEE
jgi:hypothetical protein